MMEETLLSLEQVLEATGGMHLLGNGTFHFTSVKTDSRDVCPDTLFVPLIGEQQDGHKYIGQALEKGASVVFMALKNFEANSETFVKLSLSHPKVFFIGVENTLTALQKIASCYVDGFENLIKIGITGSSGKTTTKEIAAAILSQHYTVVTNKGNFNSETGLPLSVFAIRKEHQVGLFEMGMNRRNEMKEIADVLKPRFAVITNIGTAHIGILGSREAIAEEKSQIFRHFKGFGTAIIPKDDDFCSYLTSQADGKIVYYGDGQDESISLEKNLGLSGFVLNIGGEKATFPLPGMYNYKNALAAMSLAKALGLSFHEIAQGIESVKPLFGRSEVIETERCTIVQDCYNANPDSMSRSLSLVSDVPASSNVFLVLGDMLELGAESVKSHVEIGREAAATRATVLFIGNEMKHAYDEAVKSSGTERFLYYKDSSDASLSEVTVFLKGKLKKNDVVLIKGSRGMALERLTSLLSNGDVNA